VLCCVVLCCVVLCCVVLCCVVLCCVVLCCVVLCCVVLCCVAVLCCVQMYLFKFGVYKTVRINGHGLDGGQRGGTKILAQEGDDAFAKDVVVVGFRIDFLSRPACAQ